MVAPNEAEILMRANALGLAYTNILENTRALLATVVPQKPPQETSGMGPWIMMVWLQVQFYKDFAQILGGILEPTPEMIAIGEKYANAQRDLIRFELEGAFGETRFSMEQGDRMVALVANLMRGRPGDPPGPAGGG